MDSFIYLFFGHFFGDYMFQNNWMALNKKRNLLACLTHCITYTIIVVVFLSIGGVPCTFKLFFLIFLSHVILDGTKLVDRWMKFYGTRSWDTDLPEVWTSSMTAEQVVGTIFGSIIYVVVDNVLHLLMMFLIVKYLI